MIHRVGNRGRRADIAELADALDACRIDETVFFRDENDFKLLDIGIHRDEIVRQIVVDVARDARIDFGRFMQRRADAPTN
jgi:chemotaxis methyl-accepting protein methylase